MPARAVFQAVEWAISFGACLALLVEAGKLMPILDQRRFSLGQAAEAHAAIEGGHAHGKIVIGVTE
ncbi:zinc-binding dehydrogenase [Magnetospirillum sulfuroxidans]